jgi:hypothetical protein
MSEFIAIETLADSYDGIVGLAVKNLCIPQQARAIQLLRCSHVAYMQYKRCIFIVRVSEQGSFVSRYFRVIFILT